MPKVAIEVDEVEYANQQRLTQLYAKMMADPKAREQLTRAAKLVNPQAVTPELDAKDEVLARLAESDAKREALEARIVADQAEREQEKQLAAFTQTWEQKRGALRKMGYLDDGIAKIEEFAQERGLADLEAAEALFAKQNPPQQVAQSSGFAPFDSFNPSERDNENFKKLIANGGQDDPLLENQMIREVLDDYRSGRTR